jgi:hypothetical protein
MAGITVAKLGMEREKNVVASLRIYNVSLSWYVIICKPEQIPLAHHKAAALSPIQHW